MKIHRRKTFNGKRTACGMRIDTKMFALNLRTYANFMHDFGHTICRKCWKRMEAK